MLIDDGIKLPAGDLKAAIHPSNITESQWREKFLESTKNVVVVDTNAFIKSQATVKDLIDELHLENVDAKRSQKSGICIPYVVYWDELNNDKSKDIRAWITNELRYVDGIVTVEGRWDVPDELKNFFILDNDSCILRCCLYLKSLGMNVTLLTNDRTLLDLAKIEGVQSYERHYRWRHISQNVLSTSGNYRVRHVDAALFGKSFMFNVFADEQHTRRELYEINRDDDIESDELHTMITMLTQFIARSGAKGKMKNDNTRQIKVDQDKAAGVFGFLDDGTLKCPDHNKSFGESVKIIEHIISDHLNATNRCGKCTNYKTPTLKALVSHQMT